MPHVTRPMTEGDLQRVEAIHCAHTGGVPPAAWKERVGGALLNPDGGTVARVAVNADGVAMGYVIGEIRSWEFGSEAAGWVFAVGTDPDARGTGIGRTLLGEVMCQFRDRGVTHVRTMVRRDDVAVLRFFRSAGFQTGPYTELERELPTTGE